jgi:peptidoglycan biosynthesis protein MviN/MurJ (putative lipid II flippase)
LSVAVYLAVALSLLRPLGMLGLVLADSAKQISHALTMLILTRRRIGRLADLRLGLTAGKALLAAGVMAGLMALALGRMAVLAAGWSVGGLLSNLLLVASVGGGGVLAYVGLTALLRVEELRLVRELVGRRLQRSDLD